MRVFRQYFLDAHAAGKEIENKRYPNSYPTYAGLAEAYIVVNRNSLKKWIHRFSLFSTTDSSVQDVPTHRSFNYTLKYPGN